MKEQSIPVVWGLDKKYVLQAFVVMRSILVNSEEKYHFYILTIDNIEEEADQFTRTLEKEYGNFKVSVIHIDSSRFERIPVHNEHLSTATYFRLLIAESIREYDKCIYLDCDVIVHGNLKELYEIELEDNYLAGVKDCHIIAETPYEAEHRRITGLPAHDRYINAGVLLMNLKKMRQDKIELRFMEQLRAENRYEDQDVLNVCCYPSIKTIPLQYNLFHFYMGGGIKYLYGLPYSEQDFAFDHDSPYILHMGGIYKAWLDFNTKGAHEWWKLAEVFSRSDSYQFYWQKCTDCITKDMVSDILERISGGKEIVIWGFSKNGKRLCDILLEYQPDGGIFFADNNMSLLGKEYRGISVIEPAYIKQNKADILWLVSCQISYREVIRQLTDSGICRRNIIHYEDPYLDYLYLLSRCESAYDDMVTGMAKREYVRQIPDMDNRKLYIKDIMNHPKQHGMEYAYLAEKYSFCYWFEIWRREGTDNENNSYHGVPKQQEYN